MTKSIYEVDPCPNDIETKENWVKIYLHTTDNNLISLMKHTIDQDNINCRPQPFNNLNLQDCALQGRYTKSNKKKQSAQDNEKLLDWKLHTLRCLKTWNQLITNTFNQFFSFAIKYFATMTRPCYQNESDTLPRLIERTELPQSHWWT